jgi:hypothetical protein
MTISSENKKNQYIGDGSTTDFPYQFRIISEGDVIVVTTDSDGIDTVLVLNVDYSVSGVGNTGGGTVNLAVAPDVNTRVTVASNAAALQLETYVENDAFPAASHEIALDRVTTVARSALEQCSRALQVPYGTDVSSFTNLLPPVIADNAGMALALNDSASGFEFVEINEVPITQGDVTGPSSSTVQAIARFADTTGKVIENSSATISNNGTLTINSAVAAGINLQPFGINAGQTTELRFLELSANGSSYVAFKAPDSVTSTTVYTLPGSDGTSGQVLSTNGSGGLLWEDNNTGGGGGVITWEVVNANTNMSANHGYLVNNPASIDLTLPVNCDVGVVFEVARIDEGGFRVMQNSGQVVRFGEYETTTGESGYLESTATGDTLRLVCSVANTEFVVLSSIGNITII